jgi:hypothetical protein
MVKKGDRHYCMVVTPGPLIIIRFPWGVKPWRKILQALTSVMNSYGLRQKDISGIDGFDPEYEHDTDLCSKLDKAFDGDRTIVKSFDLWDWKDDSFIQIRKVK